MLFDHEAAVVVALVHDQLHDNVQLFVAVNVKIGVWLVVFDTAPVVMNGAVVLRVKFIVPVVILFALSLTTTCNIYIPSPLPVTVGFWPVVELNAMVPHVGPEILDRIYHEIHAMSPVTMICIAIPVLVMMSAPILSRGAVLSIL